MSVGTNSDREAHLVQRIQSGQKLSRLEEITPKYRELLEAHLVAQAVNELAGSYALTEAVEQAPTVEEKVAIATLIRDEAKHAEMIFSLLNDLGVGDQAILKDLRNLSCEFFWRRKNSWSESVAYNLFIDLGADYLLGDLKDCSWQPWCEVMSKISSDESYHIEHAESSLRKLANDPNKRVELQAAIDLWFPRVNVIFGGSSLDGELLRYRLILSLPDEKQRRFYNHLESIFNPLEIRLPPITSLEPLKPPSARQPMTLRRLYGRLKKRLLGTV